MVKCGRGHAASAFTYSPLAVPSRPRQFTCALRRRPCSPSGGVSLDALPPLPCGSPRNHQSSRGQSRGRSHALVEPLPPLTTQYHSEPAPDESETPQPSPLWDQSCSAWMLAHEIGVPAVLRGDFETKLLQTKAAASERARRRRALERDSGAQARVQARRVIKYRNSQRRRKSSPLEEEEDEEEQHEDEKKEIVDVDDPGSLVSPLSPTSPSMPRRSSRRRSSQPAAVCFDLAPGSETTEAQNEQDAFRLKRFLQFRKSIQRARERKAFFETTVAEYDRKAISEALEVFTDKPDGNGELSAVTTLVGCLASIGLAGATRLEYSAVVAACEELLAVDGTVDMRRLGLEALPRVREALLEAMRPHAIEHYRNLRVALRIREETPTLSLSACVVAIDAILGDLPGGRCAPLDTKALLDQVWQRLHENEAPAQGATEETFMSAVQHAREAACRILHDTARNAYRKRRRSIVSTQSTWSLPAQPEEVAIAADWDMRAEVDAGALEAAYNWAVQLDLTLKGLDPAEQKLSLRELQAMLAQLGIEPVWRGTLEAFTPLEKFMWSSCQEALAIRVGGGQRLDMAACKKLIKEVRSKVHRLVVDFLQENLQGNPSGKYLAGQAISALQVSPHTPVERKALSQELQAAIGDRTDDLRIEELASVAIRVQERLQRDRRFDELMLAQALGFEQDLQRLRAVFSEEAFAEVAAPVRLSLISIANRKSSNSSSVQADEQKCGGFLHTRGQVALGDGGKISTSGLRNLLLRLEQPVTPKAASEFAAMVTGSEDPPAQAEVDFAGVLIALYLVRDCAEDETRTKTASKKSTDSAQSQDFWHIPVAKKKISDCALRTLLVSLSMAGRLTLTLSRSEQEALIVSALRAEDAARIEREEGTTVLVEDSSKRLLQKMRGLVHMSKEHLRSLQGNPELELPLPGLVRRCRRWAFDNCI